MTLNFAVECKHVVSNVVATIIFIKSHPELKTEKGEEKEESQKDGKRIANG